MIVSIIGLCMLAFQTIWSIKDIERGTKISIIFALIGPNIFGLSYELISTFTLFLCWVLFDRWHRMVNTPLGFYELCAVLVILSGAVMTGIYAIIADLSYSVISVLGLVRVFIAIYVYKIYFARDGFEKLKEILVWAVLINAVVVLVQMTIPSSVNFFYDLYWKPSLTPLEVMVELGYFSRAFGTFGTPLYLSLLVLLAFAVFFYMWLTDKQWVRWAMLCVISVVCCYLSYSKTSYFGLVIIIALEYIMVLASKKGRSMAAKTLMLGTVFVIGIAALLVLAKDNPKLQYYLDFFKDPLSIFETRYGDEGNLQDLIEVFKEHWLFGVGLSAIRGEFVGDSAYYVALHDGGVVLLATYLILFGHMTIQSIKRKDILSITLMVVYLLIGFGTVIFTNFIGAIYIGFVLARQEQHRRSIYEENITLR